MPQKSWSAKRERQYQHIKEGLIQEGPSEQEAEEIAARTVNKERARAGGAKLGGGAQPGLKRLRLRVHPVAMTVSVPEDEKGQ